MASKDGGRGVRGGTLGLISDRNFGPFFFGNLTSNIGTWFQNVAAAVVVFNLTRSAVMVGAVSVMQFLPSLLLAPWAGALTDQMDRRRLLVTGQWVSAISAGLLALWTSQVGIAGLPGPWPVLGAMVGIGLGNALSIPSMQALVPELVRPADLDRAVALNSVTFNLARAIGPALGALTLLTLGAAVAFGVNAASYVALIVALRIIRPRPVDRSLSGDRSARGGIRYVRRHREVAMLLFGVTALSFGSDPITTLTPPIAADLAVAGRRVLTENPDTLVGLLVSAFGLGAVAATVAVVRARRWFGQVLVGVYGLTLLGAGMLGLAAAGGQATALAALALAGFGFLMAITSLTTLLLVRVPEVLRGRVMALWGVAFLGSRPLAALMDGAIADLTTPSIAAALAGLLSLAGALLLGREVRARRLVDPISETEPT